MRFLSTCGTSSGVVVTVALLALGCSLQARLTSSRWGYAFYLWDPPKPEERRLSQYGLTNSTILILRKSTVSSFATFGVLNITPSRVLHLQQGENIAAGMLT